MRESNSQYDLLSPGPVVVLGRGQSGTRFIAETLRRQGVFLGTNLNKSLDALDWVAPIEDTILQHHPKFDCLDSGHQVLKRFEDAARLYVANHKSGIWGWKLGISAFVIPVLAATFPNLKVIHVLRDGRDVMLSRLRRVGSILTRECDRKIVLGDSDAKHWWGRALNRFTVSRLRNELEMHAWVRFVRAARDYGKPLGPDRYIEVRYEDACLNSVETAQRYIKFLGQEIRPDVTAYLEQNARVDRVGKWSTLSPAQLGKGVSIGRELLEELEYLDPTSLPARKAG